MKSACGLPLIVTFEQHLQPVLKAICRFSPRGKGIVCREDVLVHGKCIAIPTDEHLHDNPLLHIILPRASEAYFLLSIELVTDISAATPIVAFLLVSRGRENGYLSKWRLSCLLNAPAEPLQQAHNPSRDLTSHATDLRRKGRSC